LTELDSVKKDFELFGKGIERLEELKQELGSLRTKGHEKEVNAIKANLKKVSAIPEIERQLDDLKKKIRGKNRKPAKRKSRSINIAKQISQLKDLVKRKHRIVTKTLSKDELEDIHEIPKIESQINEIRVTLQTISSRKNGIPKKYLKYIDEIPKIEQILSDLKSQIEKQSKKTPIGKIDSEAGLVVQKYFDDMLLNIKYEFSNILRFKKRSFQSESNVELQKGKKILQEKYGSFMQRLAEKYNHKLETDLKKDIERRLGILVKNKVDAHKSILEKSYISKIKDKNKELGKKLIENLKIKEDQLKKELELKKQESKKTFDDNLDVYKKKVDNNSRNKLFLIRIFHMGFLQFQLVFVFRI